MAMKNIVYFVTLLLVLVKFEVKGTQFFEEKTDLDKQYKIWKKSSIKTIKTKYGDIYDCVDFYKQPAFDHPLLKNHTFHPQMKPSFIPNTTSSYQGRMFRNKMRLSDEGCPKGYVPIRRMSKNDFIKARQFTEDYAASRIKSNDLRGVPGDHFAVVETNTGPSTTYKGAGGTFTIHSVPIKPTQYSSGGIIIKNGNDLIQVGWTINPSINNDYQTRLFQYFSAGTSHCFNTQCPGFVNLKEVPIDFAFPRVTKWKGGTLWMITLLVHKDPKDGNWWLQIENHDGSRDSVGFWPRQIFTTLADSASYIAVGGEAYSPLSERLPPMGNGYYPINDPYVSAFCCEFTVLDADSIIINDPQSTITSYDNWHYGVLDMGKTKEWGRLIFYGGTSKQ